MARQRTRWRPDTCSCSIEYEWDDGDSPDSRVHTVVAVVPCSDHAGLNLADGGSTVLDENQRKNKVLALILEQHPELGEVSLGGGEPALRSDAVTLSWSGSRRTRTLTVSVPQLNAVLRGALQPRVDANHGAARVVIRG